eukprot:5050208-Prymnesium_polylepis.1
MSSAAQLKAMSVRQGGKPGAVAAQQQRRLAIEWAEWFEDEHFEAMDTTLDNDRVVNCISAPYNEPGIAKAVQTQRKNSVCGCPDLGSCLRARP